MNVSTHKSYRLATATGLAAVLAAIAIPVALAHPVVEGDAAAPTQGVPAADKRSPDTLDMAAALAVAPESSPTAADRRAPDTVDAAAAIAVAADQGVLSGVRSPDTVDAAFAVRQGSDVRSPDTLDAAAKVRFPAALPSSASAPADGFDWGNFGIAAAAVGAMLLLVGLGGRAVATRQARGKGTGSVRAV